MHHGWPGNVRELRNAIEYASVQAQTDVLRASDLPPLLNACGTGRLFPERRRGDRRRRMPEDTSTRNLVTAVRCAELDGPSLEHLLDANRWHVGHTAAHLGLHRTTLWRHMQRLGLIKGPPTHEVAFAT